MAKATESVPRTEFAEGSAFMRTFTAGEKVFSGTLVALGDGQTLKPATPAGGKVVGVARMNAVTGAPVLVRTGHFAFENDSVKPVTLEHIDRVVYVKDECTVTAEDGDASGTGTPVNAAAGVLRAIDYATKKPIVEVGKLIHK